MNSFNLEFSELIFLKSYLTSFSYSLNSSTISLRSSFGLDLSM